MNNKFEIDKDKALEDDVRTMSYEDLMEAIKYLDRERQSLCDKAPKKTHLHGGKARERKEDYSG